MEPIDKAKNRNGQMLQDIHELSEGGQIIKIRAEHPPNGRGGLAGQYNTIMATKKLGKTEDVRNI